MYSLFLHRTKRYTSRRHEPFLLFVQPGSLVGVAVVVAGRLAAHARTAPTVVGPQALVGRRVTVARAAGPSGQALVEGAWWTVRGDEPLAPGDEVEVRDVDGLQLVVTRLPTEDTEDAEDAVGVEEGDTRP